MDGLASWPARKTAGEEIKCDMRPAEVKADLATGRIELFIATFRAVGDWDHHGDRFEWGAFDESLLQDMPNGLVKGFLDHRWPVGMPEVVEPIRDKGLFMVIQTMEKDAEAEKALRWCKSGVCSHGSVGYSTRESKWEDSRGTSMPAWSAGAGRVITKARLFEGSPVIWPADDDTSVVSVKSRQAFSGAVHHMLRTVPDVLDQVKAFRDLNLEEKDLARRALEKLDKCRAALGGLVGIPDPDEIDTGLLQAVKAFHAEIKTFNSGRI